MKNWLPKLLLGLALVGLIGASFRPVMGQTVDGCPYGADCTSSSTFDSTTDGWLADKVTAVWIKDYISGIDTVAGVLKVDNYQQYDPNQTSPGIYKFFYLQPGQYQVRFRASTEPSLWLWLTGVFVTVNSVDIIQHVWSSHLSIFGFSTFTTSYFTVLDPQQVKIQVITDNPAFFDYIYLEKVPEIVPTATQIAPTNTPGGPTSTPRPTSIPISQQATPMPPATAVCISAPAGGIPTYATPAVYTGTTMSIVELFNHGPVLPNTIAWSKLGNVTITNGNDHSGNRSGSALMQYDPHWNQSTLSGFTNALVYPISYGYMLWVNAWAQSDAVPVGQTAKMELWERVGGMWSIVTSVSISAQNWYPLHGSISASATDIAFVAVRSDTPSAGYGLLDDVYLYTPEGNLPYCDGSYPSGTIGAVDVTTLDGTFIQYPDDKPCPAGIMQPNNLWGMILAQLTLFLDRQMAMSPSHVLGTTRDMAAQFMLGPLGGIIQIGVIILDWSIPITMLKVYIAFQGGLAVIGIWKTIRRAFIV